MVVKKAETLPVYTLRPENSDKPLRTLHRDLLLPCGYLPAVSQIQPHPTPPNKSVKQVSPPPEDEIELSDEDILPLNWYEPLASEPVHFTTTMDVSRLPVVTTPATEPQPDMPHAPPVTSEPALTELKPQLHPEPQEAPEPKILSDSEPQLNSALDSPAELSINLSSPSSASEGDQPLRSSTRARRPPERLEYVELGRPFLKSIHSLFDGLGSPLWTRMEAA